MREPDLKDLQEALNAWPPGTQGEQTDNDMIQAIFNLMRLHGHGAVSQVTKAMTDIWDRPDHLEMYRYRRRQRLEALKRNREEILDDT